MSESFPLLTHLVIKLACVALLASSLIFWWLRGFANVDMAGMGYLISYSAFKYADEQALSGMPSPDSEQVK